MSDLLTLMFPGASRDLAAAKLAQTQAQNAKLDQAQRLAQMDARSRLYGGANGQNAGPNDPINWNPQPNVQAGAQSLMGNQTPQTGLLGGMDQFAGNPNRAQLLAQADPEAAMKTEENIRNRQAGMAAIDGIQAPDDAKTAMKVEIMGAPETAKGLVANMEQPAQVKLISGLANIIGKNGGPSSPASAPYMAALTNATQNVDMAKLHEEVRHNMSTEALASTDIQPDPYNPGGFFMIDKRNGTLTPLGASARPTLPQPPPGPMPTTAIPGPGNIPAGPPAGGAPGAAPGGGPAVPQPGAPAPQGGAPAPVQAPAVPAPANSPTNDFTPQLPPNIESRIQLLPPGNQNMVRSMITGRMAPPTGNVLKDPVMRGFLNQAQAVDPSFDEARWAARYKLVQGMADTKDQTMGGRIDSAKKLINHTTDLLNTAADLNNEGLGGNPANAVGNALNSQFSGGPPKQTLRTYQGYKEGVGDEFTRLMAGSAGAEGAKERAGNLFNQDDPIAGQVGGATAVTQMMRGQVQPLVDQYNGIMGTNVGLEQMLGPESSAKLSAIQDIGGAAKGGQPLTPAFVKSRIAKATPAKAPPNLQAVVDEARRRGLVK